MKRAPIFLTRGLYFFQYSNYMRARLTVPTKYSNFFLVPGDDGLFSTAVDGDLSGLQFAGEAVGETSVPTRDAGKGPLHGP